MPELPDIENYLHALRPRVVGEVLVGLRLGTPFLLRTVEPPVAAFVGKRIEGVSRLGKRIVFTFEGEHFAVLHLMIAGRLHWKAAGAKLPGRLGLVAFDFDAGTLLLTEAGSKKRAALHLVRGLEALAEHNPGGLEVLTADEPAFRAALTRERHTLKRALTDPHLLAGIGNAYSDEILHRARLSPFRMTDALNEAEAAQLFAACRAVLTEWTERLALEAGEGFPEQVTAFRAEMAVHGRYGKPCPVCATPVQRILYATNEANYCPTCQTDGKLLADRVLSQLARGDWPKTFEELESRKAAGRRN